MITIYSEGPLHSPPTARSLQSGAAGTDVYKGAVYLFEKSGGSWSQTMKISDNDGGNGEFDIPLIAYDNLGASVALSADGTVLSVGASGDNSTKGAVYLFEKNETAHGRKHWKSPTTKAAQVNLQ